MSILNEKMCKQLKNQLNNNILNMGIYNNGSIFGIRIYNFNDDDIANILFEEKHDEIMSY
jgi:hypothetical protein